MAYSNIDKPNQYFDTATYAGSESSQDITSLNFQPDWVWIKNRTTTPSHQLTDVVRGVHNVIYSNLTNAENQSSSQGVGAFLSNGFQVDGNIGGVNDGGSNFVAWNWLAGGTASSNTDGDITSQVSASTTSGFSIVSWTGSGASNTVGHGLSSAPELVIVKNRTDSATDWRIGNSVVSTRTFADGNGYYLEFDTGAIANPGSQTIWGSPPANPTTSVFKVGSNNSNNGSGDSMIAYCFHSVKGFSKIGSYTGNGSTDGTFVFCGFKPAWVMIKRTNSTTPWCMWDNKRNTFNVTQNYLYANSSDAEGSGAGIDIDMLSNGFKLKTTSGFLNTSGDSFIYMCFAENPLVGSNLVPNNAR